ncbi:CASP3 [Mytilus coruscus]|uniref:CASP3 n=1 Tax=Mytilus coruscus TaxID=42192 RepID=A0A6J8AUP2_MYTCO|nr:CASP3 [Mytilus coruscus]
MACRDMMDAVPGKEEKVIYSFSESNTGQGYISTAHLNQERYQISCGIAVVINNVEFESNLNLSDRIGSDEDALTIFQSFKQLGFKSERLDNATKDEMEKKFNEIKEDKKSLEETDCLIIVMMTHGTEESVFMTDMSIKTKSVMDYFNAENCRELQMKPKIFILQACRGTGLGSGLEMEVVTDKEIYKRDPNQADAGGFYHVYDKTHGEPIRIPNEADFLAVYSTSVGYTSFRTTDIGSPFVHHLSEELLNISKEDNFYKVLTRVNKKVGMEYKPSPKLSGIVTQMPCFSSHLTKELFFNLKEMANRGKLDANDKDTSTTSSVTKETERNTGQGIINKSHLDQKSYTLRTGKAVVINNTEFDSKLGVFDRRGSDGDAASLLQRFMELGFESELLLDATKDDLEKKFQEIKDDKEELQKTDCLIVAVLSHGDEDNTPVKIKALMDYFNAQNCPELIQQPKIFIFQCSRRKASRDGVNLKVEAEKKENSIPYGLETVRIPNEADFLAVYSTSLGDRSYGSTEGSSPFLCRLMKELQEMKKDDDIYTVLTKVNNKVMRFEPGNIDSKDIRQMPYFVSHLTKDLYLKQMN